MRDRSIPRSATTTDAAWVALDRMLRSIRRRPLAWLLAIWLAGWAVYAWHIVHPSSWETLWATLQSAAGAAGIMRSGRDQQTAFAWLHELGKWGQVGLYASTAMLALYSGFALWVWRRYTGALVPAVREERFRGGSVLEVIVPSGSKADARAAADMLGQLCNYLRDLSRGETPGTHHRRLPGTGSLEPERLALSLEMWSTPHTDGKVAFYVWCPAPRSDQRGDAGSIGKGGGSNRRLVEEVRHLIMAHHPRCRVRWIDDPLKQALTGFVRSPVVSEPAKGARAAHTAHATTVPPGSEVVLRWYELGLLADSKYPIGSGASDERLLQGGRATTRSGSPCAGSDPLAAIVGMLGTDEGVPIIGVQIVAAARAETAGRTQEAVNQELARLRDLEMQMGQAGKKSLGPQHDARVLALEEKSDRHGYDVAVRLVAVEAVETAETAETTAPSSAPETSAHSGRAEARLASLLRAFTQYDRVVAGVTQGFRVARRSQAVLRLPQTGQSTGADDRLREAAPLLGRWPREGVCLPRLLPFMRMGKPCLLNMAELSSIYHFPHQGLEGLSTLRWGAYKQIPPPAFARVGAAQVASGERAVLGLLDEDMPPLHEAAPTPYSGPNAEPPSAAASTVYLPPGATCVGTTPQDLRRGTYVIGPMGSGKSVFLYNQIAQCMASGRGVGLIDGKGDSYEEVLLLVPPHLEGEVLAFDPENLHRGRNGGNNGRGAAGGSARSAGRSIGLNPLDGRLVEELGVEQVESQLMALMRKMIGANWEGAVVMQRFMRAGATAVMEVEPSPTMLHLWRWLQDDGKGGNEYRERVLGRIRNHLIRDFWQSQVPGMSSQHRSSMQNVLTRIDRYIINDVRHVILQSHSTVNFREVMDQGTIFVGRVSPRLGEDQSFLGALLLNSFLMGAFARQAIPEEERRDYLLVVDEFQNFVDTGKADVERMLSMARGYRLGLMLAHQFTEQLPREVLGAILKNAQTWVLFGLQADDARLFAGYMDGLRAEDFQNLPPYYSYQRTIVGNRQTGVYSARPLPIPGPTANPGELPRPSSALVQRDSHDVLRDALQAAHVPGNVAALVHGAAGESEEERRARILKLAGALYWSAEEGDELAVQTLSMLTPDDLELYRRARSRVLDRQERDRILARPWLIPDKAERIERLSALRWGTPCVEVEALIRTTLGHSPSPSVGETPEASPYGDTPMVEEPPGLDPDGTAQDSPQDPSDEMQDAG
jgi:hypothetical protein